MKTLKKHAALTGLGAACVLSLSLGVGLMASNSATSAIAADAQAPDASTYFYDNLVTGKNEEYTLAKKFYKAFEEMNERGDFLDGKIDYAIDGIVSSDDIKGWVENGVLTVPKAFSAARDAFLTDHPELFYVNFYKKTISAGKSGGKYVGYIDSGREANVYYDNGLNTQAKVTEAIAKFNARIDEIVNIVNELEEADTYSARDVYLAKEVNKYLAENITYDYVAYDNKDDPNYIAAAYINTAYGGLVEGKAVCGGYSNSYKVIMDKLGIPCITVNGYTKNKDQNGNNAASNVYHMWNYVWLETPSATTARSARAATGGAWYSMDVTWDYSATNKYRYAVMNSSRDDEIHVNDGVISSSGYELKYPALSRFNYGSNGETDGLQTNRVYNPVSDGSKDDYGNPLVENYITVSYNGKSAKTLYEEDLYLVCRFAYYIGDQFFWTKWFALEPYRQFAELGVDNFDTVIQDDGVETRFYDNTATYYTQFAVFDAAPDVPNHVFSETLGIDQYYYFEYTEELVNNSNSIAIGEMYVNESYGTYTPPPYIQQSSASTIVISDSMRDNKITDKVVCAEDKAIVFEVTYDEPLHILDPKQPIGISFVAEHPNTKDYAKFFPVNSNGDLVELIQKPKNSGDPTLVYNTLRFKFGPSLMYEHNEEGYHFAFTNVGSAKEVTRIVNGEPVVETSNKLPNAAFYNFGRAVVACPACFNYDGRLWIDCCAQPTLLTQTDLAAIDFKDEEGNSLFSENERSQMMLVAEKASNETVDEMLDGIGGIEGSNVTKDDIHTSETYDITLQMCNKYPKIPDGSYVKIALGFPEGYGPDDEGVTFKLYHRKHLGGDNYIIEEVPCVVTQFGIVATVTSFSPYMVAVVDADKATDKTVYASIEGKGGKLSVEDGKIRTLKEGESYTYTIQPDKGYQIYSVTLNGVSVLDKITDGKLTIGYADLTTNNELVIKYIANEAAARFEEKEIVEPVKVVVPVPEPEPEPTPNPNPDDEAGLPGEPEVPATKDNTAVIIIGVIAGVLAVGAIVAIVFAVKSRKN